MKKIITIIFLLFFISVNAQKVKKRTSKTALGETEIYHVLKSDKKVKHGKYLIKNPYSNNLRVSGAYAFGKKDGLWIEYNVMWNKLKSRGYYKNGIKIGIWQFYDFSGKHIQEYDYNAKELVSSKEIKDGKEYEAIIEGNLVQTKLDLPPSYIGSSSNLNYEISEKLSGMSMIKMDEENSKKLFLVIKINCAILVKRDGTIGDIKYTQNEFNTNSKFSIDIKEFIEKEVRERKGQWLVAELNGQKVDAYLPIGFGIH